MPVYRLVDELVFPPPEDADPSGLLAVGGDLSPERLLLAYSQGIFPWYEESQPILWHSPDPRLVLVPSRLHISKSLRKTLRQPHFEVRLDTAFDAVIRACARLREGREGTWITAEMEEAYCELHRQGFAHSAEAWRDGEIVGGLYGVSIGGCFFGESMFALESDASKVALARLAEQLQRWKFDIIDCQVHTDHLARMGAEEWSRDRFLSVLRRSVAGKTRRGSWCFDEREDPE